MGLMDKIEKDKNVENEKKKQRGRDFRIVESDIDKLYKSVVVEKKIKLVNAAKKLGMPFEKVEELAKVLHKRGLSILHYPLFGSPELLIKESGEHSKDNQAKEQASKKKESGNLSLFALIIILLAAAAILILKKLNYI